MACSLKLKINLYNTAPYHDKIPTPLTKSRKGVVLRKLIPATHWLSNNHLKLCMSAHKIQESIDSLPSKCFHAISEQRNGVIFLMEKLWVRGKLRDGIGTKETKYK